MKIKWNGHACFTISLDSGCQIVTDPFDPSVGYPCPTDRADIVTISHGHHDHDYISTLTGVKQIVKDGGRHEFPGVTITGYPCAHDHHDGKRRGSNMMYLIEAEGKRVFHLGDLGHLPTEDMYAFLMDADVLLIPIGGYFTINTDEAIEIIRRVKPKLSIPMHYKTDVITYPIEDEARFQMITDAAYAARSSVSLQEALPSILILDYHACGDDQA